MSAFSQIDLSRLPPAKIIETLSFEEELARLKNRFLELAPDAADVLNYESEPLVKMMQLFAEELVSIKAEVNDASKANMLAYSYGSNLEHLAALFGIQRLVVRPANDAAIPPVPAILESDDALRVRTQLSLEGHTTAGSFGSYTFWAMSASGKVKDVSITRPEAGLVDAAVLSHDGTGIAGQDLLEKVRSKLNDEYVRPLCDTVSVRSAEIIAYEVEAVLTLYDGPDSLVVKMAAQKATRAYMNEHSRLGHDITLSGLYRALHQPGVQNVEIIKPQNTIGIAAHQSAYSATAPVITIGGIDA